MVSINFWFPQLSTSGNPAPTVAGPSAGCSMTMEVEDSADN